MRHAVKIIIIIVTAKKGKSFIHRYSNNIPNSTREEVWTKENEKYKLTNCKGMLLKSD